MCINVRRCVHPSPALFLLSPRFSTATAVSPWSFWVSTAAAALLSLEHVVSCKFRFVPLHVRGCGVQSGGNAELFLLRRTGPPVGQLPPPPGFWLPCWGAHLYFSPKPFYTPGTVVLHDFYSPGLWLTDRFSTQRRERGNSAGKQPDDLGGQD